MMDRLKEAFGAALAAMLRQLPYAGEYRYAVTSCDWDAQTLDLLALDVGQPNLTKVPMRVPGLRLDIAAGTEVLVSYAGMNPTRPNVTSFGQSPSSVLRVDVLGGTTPAALQGMAVQVTIPANSFVIAVVGSATGTLNPAPVDVTGTITGGSATIRGLA